MKVIKINNEIKVYHNLPKVFVKANGDKINSFDISTEQELYELGFKDLVKDELLENQYYDSIDNIDDSWYNANDDMYHYNIINKTPAEILEELNNLKKSLILNIEASTDEFIRSVIGERGNEYQIAEAEAKAYKDAGYPLNDVPQSVSSDAIANNRTNQEACDLILLMATNWRTAQSTLRANRLLLKAQVNNATTKQELDALETQWYQFIDLLKSQIIE